MILLNLELILVSILNNQISQNPYFKYHILAMPFSFLIQLRTPIFPVQIHSGGVYQYIAESKHFYKETIKKFRKIVTKKQKILLHELWNHGRKSYQSMSNEQFNTESVRNSDRAGGVERNSGQILSGFVLFLRVFALKYASHSTYLFIGIIVICYELCSISILL